MENQSTQRLFTRADVENFFLKEFNDRGEIVYSVESVSLLPEMMPISWVVYYTFTSPSGRHVFYNSAVVCQRNSATGEPRLWLAMETRLPGNLPTPADEDVAVEQRKAREYAAWLCEQGQGDASAL